MLVRKMVVLTTWLKFSSAAFKMAAIFSSTRLACSEISSETIWPVLGSSGICPAQKSSEPLRMACE